MISKGDKRLTRNGNVYSLFGEKVEFDLTRGFPLMTTKKVFMRGIFEELKFFLLGQTDANILSQKGVHIWDANTSKEFIKKVGLLYNEGDMGPIYGHQFRHYGTQYIHKNTDYTNCGFDQLQYVINELKTNPSSRRIIMTTYNPIDAQMSVLFPCHGITIQFYVENEYLSCSMTQRSCDIMCGFPFNLASYALFVHILCEIVNSQSNKNLKPGRLIMMLNDVHLYEEHLEQAKTQTSRELYNFPLLQFKKKISKVEDLEWKNVEILHYKCHPAIKTQMVP